MKARAFNNIFINKKDGYLIKSSTYTDKLKDEINYYLNLPQDLRYFFPKLINYESDYSAYQLELIPYKTLAEQLLDNSIKHEDGMIIINNLMTILDKIHAHKARYNENMNINDFCIKKTLSRIKELENIEFFHDLLNADIIYINDKPFQGFSFIKSKFITYLKKIAMHSNTIMHGDFCFSNILYCPQKKDIKLIDPRGSFNLPGIYGHPFYDYAKLLHCLHGRYDYIINNNFILEEKKHFKFYLNIGSSTLIKQLYDYFIKILNFRNVNIDYLFLIEGSLFLSMVSLHYENFERQKILFLLGLLILNNVFNNQN